MNLDGFCWAPEGAAARFLVVQNPSSNLPRGLLRTCKRLSPRGDSGLELICRAARKQETSHVHAIDIDISATPNVTAVGPDRNPKPMRSFGTFTADLHRTADWFERCGIETVAMEKTGVYWIPAYEVLKQRGFAVVLVNARDAKHVPGRKADVSDARWLQRAHKYGLLRASFRPDTEIATFRDDLRQRERLPDYAASHIQHMQKALTRCTCSCITWRQASPM